jgi:carboxyl-terminal processing protease
MSQLDDSAPSNPYSPTGGSPQRPGINRLALGCLGAIIVLAIFVVGAGIGFGFGRISAGARIVGSAALNGAADADLRAHLDANFETFWDAMDVLYGNYYGELPQGDEATYSAIRGVVNSLGDPNSSFYSPEEAEIFRTNITGAFEGIGARVDWDEEANTVRVVEPFENQPAWNAGIKRDDLILAVNGESVVGTDLNEAVAKIRGPKGSTAVLTIVRAGENEGEPFDVEVVRDRIETPTISTDTFGEDGEIAYVRLYTFNENAGALVKQAVEDATRAGAAGLILDLRGNTGGLLREAVKVSSFFLDDSVVLLERFKNGEEQVYHTEGSAIAPDLPMVVLVNEGSASASEIVAGALQDAGRAELIGTVTFGKGSVQLPETLDDGSIMRVTIARWYTPKGRTIDGTGLTPDIEVPLSDEAREGGDDPQLDRAIEEVMAHLVLLEGEE